MTRKPWLMYALLTTTFWGVWGAYAGLPTQHGFPETLVYVVWALTMIPPALYAWHRVGWRFQADGRSIYLGLMIGLLGAGGQMLLFHAVHVGPTYLIFPIIALSPVVTIALSLLMLGERVSRLGALGIALALLALPTFDYAPGGRDRHARCRLVLLRADHSGGLGGAGLLHEAREPDHERRDHLSVHDAHRLAADTAGLVDDRL